MEVNNNLLKNRSNYIYETIKPALLHQYKRPIKEQETKNKIKDILLEFDNENYETGKAVGRVQAQESMQSYFKIMIESLTRWQRFVLLLTGKLY
jgi:CRISPR/Cas system CSM-associated protein Csm2 small subunit